MCFPAACCLACSGSIVHQHSTERCPDSFLVTAVQPQVIAQCQHCQAWHKLADAANLVEEIRYADLEDNE